MLVEAVVSILLLWIAMAMTVIIVTVLTKNAPRPPKTRVRRLTRHRLRWSARSYYVRDAISPVTAAAANLGTVSTTSPCWGTSPVSSQEYQGLNGWPSAGTSTSQLNEILGVVYAHDFNMEFCGYRPETAAGVGAQCLRGLRQHVLRLHQQQLLHSKQLLPTRHRQLWQQLLVRHGL